MAWKKELRLLNRVLRWTDEGITWEPDSRHIDLLYEQLGVDRGSLNSVSTPAVKEKRVIDQDMIEHEAAMVNDLDECEDGDAVAALEGACSWQLR